MRLGKEGRSDDNDLILSIQHLTVQRGGRTILSQLDAEVRAGEIVGVVGANGCGKSTLLTCIAGVLAPHDGRVAIDGASVWGSRRERERARRSLGYVPEGADPPGFLRATELWALCSAARGVAMPDAQLREAFGLDDLTWLALERMSLGQKRRACLGAAWMGPPRLLVLDEPDNGLDAKRAESLVTMLREHAAAGRAAIVSSHDGVMLDAVGARIINL